MRIRTARIIDRERIHIVILDNSDIYSGISQEDWEIFQSSVFGSQFSDKGQPVTQSAGQQTDRLITDQPSSDNRQQKTDNRLVFVFAHKTPFHPESKHVMGEDSAQAAKQANQLIKLIEESKVDGFFSGDLHFFAKYQSPQQSVRITMVGAVSSERNFQGPRFAILTVYGDYSWEVEDVEIR